MIRPHSRALVFLVAGALLAAATPVISQAATPRADTPRTDTTEPLSLDGYLSQVTRGNDAVVSSTLGMTGARLRSEEGWLLTSPNLFANAQLTDDQKFNPFFPGLVKQVSNIYQLGFSQQTPFGLQGRLFYQLGYYNYVGTGSPPYHEGRPGIELTQSLWRNGFGYETRAQVESTNAAALAQSFNQSYNVKALLADAEATYWRLALARETIAIQQNAIERSNKIYEWSARRARLQLGDHADELQALAALEVRKLQLQQAFDDERTASLAFNRARGDNAPTVAEKLELPDLDWVSKLGVPARAEFREDVKAAREQSRAADANATIGQSRNQPTLEVFGSYAANGRGFDAVGAVDDSWNPSRPTLSGGVRFSTPLQLERLSDNRRGYGAEREAAERAYQRKVFEQEEDWADLTSRLGEARHRLELARSIELAEDKKLRYERERLSHGRTTTYQVLLFEQDFDQAQLGRIQAEADVLSIVARMKTYGPPA